MSDDDIEDVDERLADLFRQLDALDDQGLKRSSRRIGEEICRLAKRHQRLVPYLRGQFWLMNLDQSLFNPAPGRDVAIELIALLESEDRARLFQADFSEDEYAETVAWMSACAYDNLAKHTATMTGYNSEGMHACIGEGIEVCRRTGKLRCINCFREYASDVHRAADDLDMALHHARVVAGTPPGAPGSERRYVGAKEEAALLLLCGQLEAAEAAVERAQALAPAYHNPLEARLETQALLDQIQLMAGKGDRLPAEAVRELPAGENPRTELDWDKRDAVRAAVARDFDTAIQRLTPWDRRLRDQHCLDEWFEVRLRLLSLFRLAGRDNKVEALARPLEERAKEARDWLTLRRLARILIATEPAAPLALVGPATCGPYAARPRPIPSVAEPEAPAAAEDSETTPLEPLLNRLFARLDEVGEAAAEEVLGEILAVPAESVTHPFDAARLLHLCRMLLGDGRRGPDVWAWAVAVGGRFPEQASVLNLLATLGDVLRGDGDGPMGELVPAERVEQLFRQSLDLDPGNPHNFARAGAYFLAVGNAAEAERCLARGFRLDRANSFLALRLAEAYQNSDRPRDALAVLDLSLRAGCADAKVAWEAAVIAQHLERHEETLTYLDRFEALSPGQLWACYYRALALLDLGRPAEALPAIDEEERRDPERTFLLLVLRACAAAALGDTDTCRRHIENAMALRLASISYLMVTGLTRLFARLWKAAECLPADDPLRSVLVARTLAAGMAPDEVFDEERSTRDEEEGMSFYRCKLRQPLDDDWPDSAGCLTGQEAWQEYRILWGVLAPDEDAAAEMALAWQARCYPRAAIIEEIELQREGYTDRPGVVWQGARWAEAVTDD